MASRQKSCAPTREGAVLDSTVLGGTYWELELACLDCRDGFEDKDACAQRRGPPDQPWSRHCAQAKCPWQDRLSSWALPQRRRSEDVTLATSPPLSPRRSWAQRQFAASWEELQHSVPIPWSIGQTKPQIRAALSEFFPQCERLLGRSPAPAFRKRLSAASSSVLCPPSRRRPAVAVKTRAAANSFSRAPAQPACAGTQHIC